MVPAENWSAVRGRTGWVMRKVPLPESDSDHMHRCAMCAMLLSQPPDPRDDYSGDAGRFHLRRRICDDFASYHMFSP